MANDIIKLNAVVEDIGRNVSELSQIGRDGFKVPLVTTPDELTNMAGLPMGPWHPLSDNLIWFYALKTIIYTHQMLEEAQRLFQQIEDETSACKVQTLIEATDTQFHPGQTAFQVYRQLLAGHSSHNGVDSS